MPRISVSVPQDLYDAIARMAEGDGRKVSDVARDAVAQYMGVEPQESIGEVAEDAIRKGLTNAQTLERLQASFKDTNASLASVAWYRARLKKNGENVFSDFQARNKSTRL